MFAAAKDGDAVSLGSGWLGHVVLPERRVADRFSTGSRRGREKPTTPLSRKASSSTKRISDLGQKALPDTRLRSPAPSGSMCRRSPKMAPTPLGPVGEQACFRNSTVTVPVAPEAAARARRRRTPGVLYITGRLRGRHWLGGHSLLRVDEAECPRTNTNRCRERRLSGLSRHIIVRNCRDPAGATDNSRKAAPMLRPTVGERPGLRCRRAPCFPPFEFMLGAQESDSKDSIRAYRPRHVGLQLAAERI